jgi:choice-of-anchor A domain-containing protein
MRRSALVLLAGLALTAVPSGASAGALLGAAGQFNVFALNDFTQQNTDSHGAVAAGGKFDPGGTINTAALNGSGSFSVGSRLNGGATGLVVGGHARNQFNTVNGKISVGGNATMSGLSTNGDVTVHGNLTRTSGFFTGNYQVGGDATFNTISGNGNVTTNGSLTAGGGGFLNGNISHYGTLHNNTGYKFYSGSNTQLGSPEILPDLPIDFAREAAFLNGQSRALNALADTGTVTLPSVMQNYMTITGTNSDYDVVHITGADLTNLTSRGLKINGVAGSTMVINVTGSVAEMVSFGITLSGLDRQHVLFNFSEAESLKINQIGVLGSILAPGADINFAGGNIDGTLIGRNIYGQGESHLYLFEGDVPLSAATPEPSTLAGATIGIIGGAWALRRRSRKKGTERIA